MRGPGVTRRVTATLRAADRQTKENLARCLEAYDGEGEAGLERELDRIYPPKLSGVTAFDLDGNIMDPATVPVRGAMDALARQKKNLP